MYPALPCPTRTPRRRRVSSPSSTTCSLSHANRARIIPDGLTFAEFSKKWGFFMAPRGGVLRGNILVDGMLQGVWRIMRQRRDHTLVVEPFVRLSAQDAAALEEDGRALLAFAADRPAALRVETAPPAS
ncbi:DNA glycosylase AlkZ-like family protein [Streptomyces sp. NPDC048297]|uniref:DNA glycosylase AlkZ-like family protein n=1 Tax=Streptomyces sp. NPDC048297 TaxID=3365531 RepID=UPI0037211270